MLDAGCWILDAGCWILDAGCWILDAGCWILDAGYWMLDAGCWILDAGCWMLGCELLTLNTNASFRRHLLTSLFWFTIYPLLRGYRRLCFLQPRVKKPLRQAPRVLCFP